MKQSYLEVTYRHGRPLAGYYYLPRRDGDTSARTERTVGGLIVDFTSDGRPIGIEIVSPGQLNLTELNSTLLQLGQEPVLPEEMKPLMAA